MRWFLLWLAVSWMVGIMSGVVGLEWEAGLLSAGALWYWGWRMGLLYPVLVAGVGLVGAGYVYGFEASGKIGNTSCVQERINEEGLVWQVWRQEEDRSQYVVNTTSGCTLLVTLPVWPKYGVGDEWHLQGKVERVEDLPVELEGYGEYLRREGIGGTMRYPEVDLIDEGSSVWGGWREGIREQTNRVLREPEASVIRAMLWGERGAAGEAYEEQLTAAGVRHILAISGLHVSIVLGGLLALSRLVSWPRYGELAALLILLWGYVWLVGAPVSAMRAGWFWTVFLVGWRGQMLVSLLTALVITLVVMVSLKPMMILDVGLQLSVSAVTGIALALKVLDMEKSRRGFSGVAVRGLVGAMGAMLATGPITTAVFGEVSWVGLVVNVLVLPVMPLLLGAALGAVGLAVIWEPLGLVGGLVVRVVWWYVERVTMLAASVPGGHLQAVEVPDWWLVWWYPLLVISVLMWLNWRGKNWRVIWE